VEWDVEELLRVGFALWVETERRDAATAEGIAEDEVEGVDAWQVVALDRAVYSVGEPGRHGVDGELVAKERKEVRVTSTHADVGVRSLVAAAGVRDCDQRKIDGIGDGIRVSERARLERRPGTRGQGRLLERNLRPIQVDLRMKPFARHEVASKANEGCRLGKAGAATAEARHDQPKGSGFTNDGCDRIARIVV
jgi:hypothetical protein